MTKIKLTKRKYLGERIVHIFTNNVDGSVVYEEIDEKQYSKMTGKGGSEFNPVKEGFTYTGSYKGMVTVDTEDGTLGDNEYCEIDGEYMIKVKTDGGYEVGKVKKEKIKNNEIELWQ